jgi:hypothetical protein
VNIKHGHVDVAAQCQRAHFFASLESKEIC